MKMKSILWVIPALMTFSTYAQKNALPEITAKDFESAVYSIDSSAQAVILYDGGLAEYEANNDSWFNIIYTFHKRVRLLDKKSFDAATIKIPLYTGDQMEETVSKLEAVTYTMENGVLVKTKLDKASIFTDKASKDFSIQKFTFPNLKEGCIIDYSYRIVSPAASRLKNWYFQDRFPVLKSEYEVTVPKLFNFVVMRNGYYDLTPVVKSDFKSYRILMRDASAFSRTEIINYDATVVNSKWSLTNLPALKPESFTTTIQNHLAKLEFQLRSYDYPNAEPKPVMQTWDELVTGLLKDENFGADLDSKNNWMEDDLKKLAVKGDDAATMQNIFRFVRDNFSCTDHEAKFMEGTLKKAYQARKGNVADLNLILVAMLKKAGIKAEPVLLSTRENGLAYEQYPMLSRFNYLIARAEIKEKEYLLDASAKKLGFNHLPEYCYNGSGRRIAHPPYLTQLNPDSLRETKQTLIFINNAENGKGMTGSFASTLGYYESYDFRNEMATTTKEDYFKKIKTSYTYDIDLQNTAIDSLNEPDERVLIGYDFNFNMDEDIIYFNPLLTEAYKTNPFVSAARNYPVEMPYTTNELISLTMEIPRGYKVDELPKSARLSFNDGEATFDYLTQADAQLVQISCKIKVNKAVFSAEDYQFLREFYGQIVKKQAEQIVFKKIK